ncbi:hypothetical protein J2X11_001693 [Aeromicrobium panaciterrae]|uniref:HNH nuclease domain-containing protein n=1 Tax=Aeromicrobium panaciterrae TaxID=363861 RepID=A0ABU1UNX1_9ACTN|nr:HNH endonuclease signature motif containing protein [Aeromicrobium panaciterrae]MDR7086854.1 hypothetical protein [Aeromicrobium panaciterrae]
MPIDPSETHAPTVKVGALVKANLDSVIAFCETEDEGEILRLLDPAYSNETFGLNFPFCKLADDIAVGSAENARYWKPVFTVGPSRIRVTSMWFEKSAPRFIAYLAGKGIVSETGAVELAARAVKVTNTASKAAVRSKGRYKGHAIGNAQNSFVRTMLSNLGQESFTQHDWNATIAYFDHRCAYCGVEAKLVVDHAVPINRESLGEHRLGNLVPSCDPCNSKKKNTDFREFSGDNEAVISRIEAYMDSRGYKPLGDNEQIRLFLKTAYTEVGDLAQRYLLLLNSFAGETDAMSVGVGAQTTVGPAKVG